MKNKGFTLVELLAVIVILGIIMVIVTYSVVESINESKRRVKYLAAKEITEMADTYFATENSSSNCVDVLTLIDSGLIEEEATNPESGENGGSFTNHKICKDEDQTEDDGFELIDNNYYSFDGYVYCIGEYPCSEFLE